MIFKECCLRAGVQASSPCGNHEALQEHAIVQQAPFLKHAVNREEQANRRPEEAIIPAVLLVHPLFIASTDAQQAIEPPPYLPAPFYVGRCPLPGVIRVGIRKALVISRMVINLSNCCGQPCLHIAGNNMHVPGLQVDACCAIARNVQNRFNFLSRNWGWEERPDAPT
ncbi:hypothetical protein D9M73_197550 [compost metagenome]